MGSQTSLETALTLTSILGAFLKENEMRKEPDFYFNPADLRKMAEKHSLTAITAAALEAAGMFGYTITGSELEKWSEIKWKAIRKNILVEQETEKLLQYMEDHEIWNLPLKGHIISKLYPEVWMREMSDRDILIDPMYRAHMKKHMLEQGYTVEKYRMYVDDVYLKKPVYNFELHWGLFDQGVFRVHYETIYERLIPEQGYRFRMCFTDEDAYVYIMAHAYKHYSKGGIGIRSLLDIYVWNQKKPDMDAVYVADELKALGIFGFTVQMEKLANKLFSGKVITEKDLDQGEARLLSYIVGSGTYGTLPNMFSRMIQQANDESRPAMYRKSKYLLSRLFPERELLYPYFRYAEEHGWALPVAWFKRLFIYLTEKRGRFKTEWRILKTFRMEKGIKDDKH